MAESGRVVLKTYFETGDIPTEVQFADSIDSSVNIKDDIENGTEKAVPIDADKFSLWDSVASALKTLTWANLKATLKTYFDTLYVRLTTNQTIAGVKTFTSFPVTPSSAPTTDYQTANKKYVDDNGGGGGASVVYKTADESRINTTTLVIDADLQLELDANSIYMVELKLYNRIQSTPDFKFTFEIPTNAVGNYSTDLDNIKAPVIDWTAETTFTGSNALSRGFCIGTIETIDAGTFGLKWAPINSSANYCEVKKGATLSVTKLN